MNELLELGLSNFWPAVCVSIAFPALMLVCNEFIAACDRRQLAISRTLRSVRNLVVPVAALHVFTRFILELPQTNTVSRLIETSFWVFLLFAALGIVNDVVFGAGSKESWRGRVPKLFSDLLRALLVAIGAMVIYSNVWGREVQGALTALGVGSVVIGLALQEPLGNIVSGLMLLFERPLKVGDWVSAEGVTGKVIEINWRSVHILTPTRELRIVPNVRLYKGAFSNLSRPTDTRTEALQIGFSYDDPPNRVKEVLGALLAETPGILRDPAPAVRTVEYSDFSVIYRVSFSVAKQEELAPTRDQFMTRLWYAVRRAGLTIPFPITMEYSPGENPGAPKVEPSEWLRNYPRFKPAIQNAGAATPRVMEYAIGETIQAAGSRFSGFALILTGQARLRALSSDGALVEVGQIGPGECFGEQLTAGPAADAIEITAVNDTRVMVFEGKAIGDLLNQSPGLAAEIGDAIESRHQAALAAQARTNKKLSVNAA
jgi:small-conductance mechanosensitive channel/CRP-like cAMP-binding protein